jgi:hypothetical protein
VNGSFVKFPKIKRNNLKLWFFKLILVEEALETWDLNWSNLTLSHTKNHFVIQQSHQRSFRRSNDKTGFLYKFDKHIKQQINKHFLNLKKIEEEKTSSSLLDHPTFCSQVPNYKNFS